MHIYVSLHQESGLMDSCCWLKDAWCPRHLVFTFPLTVSLTCNPPCLLSASLGSHCSWLCNPNTLLWRAEVTQWHEAILPVAAPPFQVWVFWSLRRATSTSCVTAGPYKSQCFTKASDSHLQRSQLPRGQRGRVEPEPRQASCQSYRHTHKSKDCCCEWQYFTTVDTRLQPPRCAHVKNASWLEAEPDGSGACCVLNDQRQAMAWWIITYL